MKKIYLSILLAAGCSGLHGQTIKQTGFEGEIGPHPDYNDYSERFDLVTGWEGRGAGVSFNASAEINAPFAGSQSLILKNVEDAALISGPFGNLLQLSGTIVPGVTGQIIELGEATNLGSIQIGFMYKYTASGDPGIIRAQVLDTVGTDKVLFEGKMYFNTTTTDWTAGLISMAATAETGSAYILRIDICTSKEYIEKDPTAKATVQGLDTELKIDGITMGYLGINETNAVNVIAFPNPTVDVLHFSSLETIKNINIYDVNGKLVMNSSSSEMIVKELNNGVYNYEVVTISGKVSRNSFVKN